MRSLRGAFFKPWIFPFREKARFEFQRLQGNIRKVQHKVLGNHLAMVSESRFARDSGISDKLNPREFQNTIPISKYKTFEPYIEAVRNGDKTALFHNDVDVVLFTMTSGTTGINKYIPLTGRMAGLYEKKWFSWGAYLFYDHPGLFASDFLHLSRNHKQFYSQGGVPCGSSCGFHASIQPWFVRAKYVLPREIETIGHQESKFYLSLLLALTRKHLRTITTTTPFTLLQFAKWGHGWREDLLRDLADRRVGRKVDADPAIVDMVNRLLKRSVSAGRVRELEWLAATHETFHPYLYWPEMEIIGTWTGGSFTYCLQTLREMYRPKALRDIGYMACEGRFSIPLQDDDPVGILDLESNFYEFIPEEEYGGTSPATLLAWELEPSRNYYIVITSASGLIRYDMEDMIRCEGFAGQCPLISFVAKAKHVVDLTGEKLSTSQVSEASARVHARLGQELGNFVVIPVEDDPPYYELVLEKKKRDLAEKEVAPLFDRFLREMNPEYEEHRDINKLGPMALRFVTDGILGDEWRRRITPTAGLERYKPVCLTRDPEFIGRIRQRA